MILKHVDQGERDPARLANSAYRDWAGVHRSKSGERSQRDEKNGG